MSCRSASWRRAYTHVASLPRSHKSLLDYCKTQGFNATFEALQQEAGQEGFVSDPKAKYAGLLEKKWTSVIRLQKKVGRQRRRRARDDSAHAASTPVAQIMELEQRNAQLTEE